MNFFFGGVEVPVMSMTWGAGGKGGVRMHVYITELTTFQGRGRGFSPLPFSPSLKCFPSNDKHPLLVSLAMANTQLP